MAVGTRSWPTVVAGSVVDTRLAQPVAGVEVLLEDTEVHQSSTNERSVGGLVQEVRAVRTLCPDTRGSLGTHHHVKGRDERP